MEIVNMIDLTDLGMVDPSFIHDALDDISSYALASSLGESLCHSFPHPISDLKRNVETYKSGFDRPVKMMKTYSWDSSIIDQLSNPQVTFPDCNYSTHSKQETVPDKTLTISFAPQNHVRKACEGPQRISTTTRLPGHQDHIISERKRREKLNQSFVALSALVPGLKKMDKASVLGDAIKYLKQLQEQVQVLKEQTKKKTMESVVFVKKHEIYGNDDDSSSDNNFSGDSHDEPLPEIEARICDRNVLIRLHCKKRRGIVEKTVAEIEKLHLSVLNNSVLTFGGSILDITVIAQMDAEFPLSIKDLVKHLSDVFKLFK